MDHIKKIMTIMDMDGHFQSADIFHRKQCISLMKQIGDGDYWTNEADVVFEDMSEKFNQRINEESLLTVKDKIWKEFISSMECRGTMEVSSIIIHIEETIH